MMRASKRGALLIRSAGSHVSGRKGTDRNRASNYFFRLCSTGPIMTSWLAIGVIAGALAGIGNAVDRLLLRNQKRVLYDKMFAWWFTLAETKFPKLHTRMASNAIRLFRTIMPARRHAWMLLLVAIGGSFVLTSVSCIIGRTLGAAIGRPPAVTAIPLPLFMVYVANFPFDCATSVTTYFALTVVVKCGPIKGIFVIFLDLAIAFALATVSWSSISWSEDLAYQWRAPGTHTFLEKSEEWMQELGAHELAALGFSNKAKIRLHFVNEKTGFLTYLRSAPEAFGSALHCEALSQEYYIKLVITEAHHTDVLWVRKFEIARITHVAMACTTLVPTAVYMVYLLFLLIARSMIEIMRLASMQFLEAATEVDPSKKPQEFKPVTLFGAAVGILALIANAVVTLLKS